MSSMRLSDAGSSPGLSTMLWLSSAHATAAALGGLTEWADYWGGIIRHGTGAI